MRRSQCRVRPQLVLELEYPKPQALLEESPEGTGRGFGRSPAGGRRQGKGDGERGRG